MLHCIRRTADIWDVSLNEALEDEAREERKGGQIDINQELRSAVQIPLSRLAAKADKLIQNDTTNLAEMWMSIRLKFDGGKIINRCGRGSWAARCYGAALRQNLGPSWSAVTWEKVTGKSAGDNLLSFGKRRAKKRVVDTLAASRPAVRERGFKRKAARDRQDSSKKAKLAYGRKVPTEAPDVDPKHLQEQCDMFFNQYVDLTQSAAQQLEHQTRAQSASKQWHEMRRIRLTASNFGDVMSKKPSTKLSTLISTLLYPTFTGNRYTSYGLAQEKATQMEYEIMKSNRNVNVTVRSTGLHVNPSWPYLGASPDGIVLENGKDVGLVEFKNVLRNKPITLEHACKSSNFCLEMSDGKLQLKRRHKYFYQCQGLIHVCGFPWLDFIVRTLSPYQFHLERLFPDSKLWQDEMLPKLKAFYFCGLLPELAVPRQGLIPGIREPGPEWIPRKAPTTSTANKSALSPHPQPSVSGVRSRSSTRLRSTSLKFVGKRVTHEWIVDEENNIRQWYEGTILRLVRGRDGDLTSEYEVQYDGDSGTHLVDHIVEDYNSHSLLIL